MKALAQLFITNEQVLFELPIPYLSYPFLVNVVLKK